MEGRSVAVFPDSGWRAAEELSLLEAVELYGFGNWEDTAALVGNRRSADQVRDHFIAYYVRGNVGRGTWAQACPETYQAVDHTCSRDGHLSPSLTTPLPAIPDLSPAEQQHLGYMPKRDDFEREFDNEVEMLISTLRINPNDEDDLDVDLKVAHIDMYNRRLRQRFRKKAVVRDYGLVSQFYKSLSGDPEIMSLIAPQSPSLGTSLVVKSEKATLSSICSSIGVTGDSDRPAASPVSHTSRPQSSSSPASPATGKQTSSSPLIPSSSSACLTPIRTHNCNSLTSSPTKKRSLSPGKSATTDPSLTSDRVHDLLRDKFKIFCQFQSALDQKQLLDNIRRERELKARIKDLIRYRKSGIRKLSEVAGLESARIDRDKKKENKKKGAGGTVSDRKALAKDSAARAKGCSASPRDPTASTASSVSDTCTNSMDTSLLVPGSKSVAAVVCSDTSLSDARRSGSGRDEASTGEVPEAAAPAAVVVSPTSKGLKEFDINSMPSARLLNAQEKKVCSSLRLTPSQYMSIKGLMIGGKSLPKKQKSGLENLDSRIKRRLQGFFTRSGWIKT